MENFNKNLFILFSLRTAIIFQIHWLSQQKKTAIETMYEIKPIFDRSSIQVDLPTCMYKMKNTNDISLQQSASSGAQLTNGFNGAVSQFSTKPLPDISQQIEKIIKVFDIHNNRDNQFH